MAQIRPKDLPAGTATAGSAVIFDNGTTVEKTTPKGLVDVAVPLASQAEAEAGSSNDDRMSSLRVKQAIDVQVFDELASAASGDGADLISFDKALAYASTSIGGQLKRFTDTIRFWGDFGIAADGVTDDSVAVQAAFDWCGPGKVLIMPSAKIKINSTVIYGNGTTTALSTVGNNCTIIWGGDTSNANALIDTSDPWYSTAKAGTRFVWGGVAGGSLFKVAGPIQGLRWIGNLTLDGDATFNGATGASFCFEAKSFSSCTIDSVVAVNWQAGGRGLLLATVDSTGVGTVGSNSVLSGANCIGRLFAYSPYGHNGECVKIDGYRVAGGPDVTVTDIRIIQCGISGTGGKGLVLGYCDEVTIGTLVNTVYGARSGSPWGMFLLGTSLPFEAPARVYIYHAAVGQGVTVGGGTNAQVIIEHFEMDDAATLPSVAGLFCRNICRTGHGTNMMALPSDGKIKTRAFADGEGYYGIDPAGVTIFSITRQGVGARFTSAGNTELEPAGHIVSARTKNLTSYADDAAAAAGGVPVGGFYRNGSILQIRVV
jgi:hypothetical protein